MLAPNSVEHAAQAAAPDSTRCEMKSTGKLLMVALKLEAEIRVIAFKIAEIAEVAAAEDNGRGCDSRRMSVCKVPLLPPLLLSTDNRAIMT